MAPHGGFAFHLLVTGAEVALGFLAAVLLGSLCAFAARRARLGSGTARTLGLLDALPLVVLAPLPALWLGSGALPKVAFAAALAAIPAALGLLRERPFEGLRAAATLACAAVLVAEMLGGTKGLGYLVAFGQRQNSATLVLAAAALAALVALAAHAAVLYAERRLVRRPRPAPHPASLGA